MAETTVRPPFDDADADIIFRSKDHIDFRLYKVVLAKASTVFRGMLALPDVNAETREPQVVSLDEDADTLEKLLRFCYPVARPVFGSTSEILPAYAAAKKYDVEVAVDAMRSALEALGKNERPLQAYAIACLLELPTLARTAARLLVKKADFMGFPAIPAELRPLSAEALFAFARYRSQCLYAVKGVLEENAEWLRAGSHPYQVQYSRGNPNIEASWVWFRCQDPAESVCPQSPFTRFSVYRGGSERGSATVWPRLWWLYYEESVKAVLLSGGLDGGVATREALLELVLTEAETCPTCKPDARTQLMVYAQALQKRIEAAIDKVRFELPFAAEPPETVVKCQAKRPRRELVYS